MFTKTQSIIAVTIMAGAVASASAQVAVVTYGFTDMEAQYTQNMGGGGGTFTARAVDKALFRTAGDVSRLLPVQQTAVFQDGFVSGLDPADVSVTISVFNIIGGLFPEAEGLGDFTITDVDGDTISGDLDGFWFLVGSGVFFNGNLSGVVITSDDGTFDGPGGGSFDVTDFGTLEGATTVLFTNSGPGFFDQDFQGISAQFNGELLPSPGALALLGLGGLVAGRRRR